VGRETRPVSARWIHGFRSQTIGDPNLREDAGSIWIFVADCCASAREMPALSVGHYRLKLVDEELLVHFREFDDATLLIVLNLTRQSPAACLRVRSPWQDTRFNGGGP